jgi:hypothetical protein
MIRCATQAASPDEICLGFAKVDVAEATHAINFLDPKNKPKYDYHPLSLLRLINPVKSFHRNSQAEWQATHCCSDEYLSSS